LGGVLAGTMVMALGWIIDWSLWPRSHRFRKPGPELSSSQHKLLFRELARVAAMADGQVPDHVYLMPGADLFVSEIGGVLGFGRRRVLGVGLSLLSVLTVSELRAALSHEMGHFVGGDTRLGVWLHRARLGAQQTLVNLNELYHLIDHPIAERMIWLVALPFAWFLPFYLRMTRSQMRQQELAADELAVKLEGSDAFCSGLTQAVRVGAVFPAWMRGHIAGALALGHVPPLSAGFREFFHSAEGRQLAALALAVENATPPDPFDSHPPVPDRVSRAQQLKIPARSKDDRVAIELLSDVSTMEKVLAKDWPRARGMKTSA
jgi:Zn-dependent protease with chaperone function